MAKGPSYISVRFDHNISTYWAPRALWCIAGWMGRMRWVIPFRLSPCYNYYCLHCGAQQDINIEQLYSYIIHDSNSPANSISNCIVTNQKYQKWDEMQCSRVGPMAGKDESRKKTKSKGLKGPSARPGSPIWQSIYTYAEVNKSLCITDICDNHTTGRGVLFSSWCSF